MKKVAIVMIILAGVVAFAAASVAGTWEMSYTTQRGETKRDIAFTQTGEILAVTWTMQPRGGQPWSSRAPVRSKEMTLCSPSRWPRRGRMKTEYKAKLADDNNMTGTFERNMGGNAQTIKWKAVRKPK